MATRYLVRVLISLGLLGVCVQRCQAPLFGPKYVFLFLMCRMNESLKLSRATKMTITLSAVFCYERVGGVYSFDGGFRPNRRGCEVSDTVRHEGLWGDCRWFEHVVFVPFKDLLCYTFVAVGGGEKN